MASSADTNLRAGFRARPTERALCAVGAIGCAALLIVAAMLTPSANGHGTHTQLGLAACDWAAGFGAPCPTCGMTTAFAWAAEGHIVAAAASQPFGLFLALATAAAFWVCLHVALTGSRALTIVSRTALRPRVVWTGALAFLAAWGYKALTWGG